MLFATLLLIPLLLPGCGSLATRRSFYKPISAEVERGNFLAAAGQLQEAKNRGKFGQKDRFLYFLDAGLLYHYAGEYDSSQIKLQLAEQAAEENFTRSIRRAAASLILNDNALAYPGEDYEVLYTNLINALNYLERGDFDGAFVEIRRADLKIELLNQKYRDAAAEMNRASRDDTSGVSIPYETEDVRFANSAFARWLGMHIYAAEGKWDNARIDRDKFIEAFAGQPNIYPFPMPDADYRPEHSSTTVVPVVTMVGLAPIKEALELRVRTDAQLDLVQVLVRDSESGFIDYGQIPMPIGDDYYFDFAIPKLADRPSRIADVVVLVDSVPRDTLQLIEDIGTVARETFRAKRGLIYLRSVARAVVKGLAAHELKEEVGKDGGLGGWLAKAAVDVVTDISESADLRSSQYLPGRIFVGQLELADGAHTITLEYRNAQGLVVQRETLEGFDIGRTKLPLVRGICPL